MLFFHLQEFFLFWATNKSRLTHSVTMGWVGRRGAVAIVALDWHRGFFSGSSKEPRTKFVSCLKWKIHYDLAQELLYILLYSAMQLYIILFSRTVWFQESLLIRMSGVDARSPPLWRLPNLQILLATGAWLVPLAPRCRRGGRNYHPAIERMPRPKFANMFGMCQAWNQSHRPSSLPRKIPSM